MTRPPRLRPWRPSATSTAAGVTPWRPRGSAPKAWCATTLPYMNKSSGVVVGDGLFARARGNPLLTPQRWPYRINAVMNAAATTVATDTVLLCRVEDRRGISHLTVARSRDGITNWVVDEQPLMAPRAGHPEEDWGLEDPRIPRVEELDA